MACGTTGWAGAVQLTLQVVGRAHREGSEGGEVNEEMSLLFFYFFKQIYSIWSS